MPKDIKKFFFQNDSFLNSVLILTCRIFIWVGSAKIVHAQGILLVPGLSCVYKFDA